jgi:hypothetical protein
MRAGIFIAAAAASAFIGMAAALTLTVKPGAIAKVVHARHDSHRGRTPEADNQNSDLAVSRDAQLDFTDLPANVLELPRANADFVGYWGGYVHASIERFSLDLTGRNPSRISVIFGRNGNTIFVSSELYAPPEQAIVRPPHAIMRNPRIAIIEYASRDNQLYYACSYRFELEDNSIIRYRGKVNVYRLNGRLLIGRVTYRATLRRLVTPRAQQVFERPSSIERPRAEVSAARNFGHN